MPNDDDMKVFSLRLPPALLRVLSEIATRQRRSVNSEILIALEAHRVRNAEEKPDAR